MKYLRYGLENKMIVWRNKVIMGENKIIVGVGENKMIVEEKNK